MTNGGTQQPAAHSVDLRGHLKGVAEEVADAFPEELFLRTWNGPEHDFLLILRNPLAGKFPGATEEIARAPAQGIALDQSASGDTADFRPYEGGAAPITGGTSMPPVTAR